MSFSLNKKSVMATVLASLLLTPAVVFAQWFPLEIDVWDPPFNTELKRKTENYTPLKKAEKSWKICTSIPHLKDPYWAAVNYGLIDQAKQLGISLRLYEAGGYSNLEVQRKQIKDCMDSGGDGLVISSISADGLNDFVEQYISAGKPVVDMINGMTSTLSTARIGVNFYDPGFMVGSYIRERHADSTEEIQVGWFPGPDGAAWVAQGTSGFNKALEGSNIKVVVTSMGDTGRATQGKLVEAALKAHQELDYIAGTTVSADAAVDLLRRSGMKDKIKVLAYYYGPGVDRGIRRKSILAAPSDLQSLQARMSIDTVVRALEGKPFFRHAGPKVIMIDAKNIKSFDTSTSLPPRGFRPIFSINDW